jgi:DNA-binding protein HU-beta
LKAKESVQIVGFGTFKVSFKPARQGRNPSTGQTIEIAASNKVSFSPGATLKNSVN